MLLPPFVNIDASMIQEQRMYTKKKQPTEVGCFYVLGQCCLIIQQK